MDEFFSALADEETKGIIIDMRGNEGGNVAELRVAFSAFFPAEVEKIHFADTRRKSGEGMLEYGPWLSFEVSKDETMTRGSFNEDIPIAVLVNGESRSAPCPSPSPSLIYPFLPKQQVAIPSVLCVDENP